MRSRAWLIAVALLLAACGSATSRASTAQPKASASAAVVRLTVEQKAQVAKALTDSANHYDQLLAGGKQALGTTQYASSDAGVAAFSDPNSAASRFSAWRTSSNAERDVSYIEATKAAGGLYNAENQPDALQAFQNDIGTVQSDLVLWVQAATSWQIKSKTTAELAAAEKTFADDLTKVRADIAQVLAAS